MGVFLWVREILSENYTPSIPEYEIELDIGTGGTVKELIDFYEKWRRN